MDFRDEVTLQQGKPTEEPGKSVKIGSKLPIETELCCFAPPLLHCADFCPGSPLGYPLWVDCSGSLLEANFFLRCL